MLRVEPRFGLQDTHHRHTLVLADPVCTRRCARDDLQPALGFSITFDLSQWGMRFFFCRLFEAAMSRVV